MPLTGGWQPLPTGMGATPMLKELRAMNAQIHGSVFASSGVLGDLTVTGTLTIGTGGTFQSAPSGRRVQMSQTNYGQFSLYSGLGTEEEPAHMMIDVTGRLQLMAPTLTGFFPGSINMDTDGAIRVSSASSGSTITLDAGSAGHIAINSQAQGAYGTALLPGWSFLADPNTGMYRYATDELGFAVGGLHMLRLYADGVEINLAAGKSGNLGLTIWNEHASGYGNIEIGGKAGAYLDFKNAEADDYDIRLITTGGDLSFQGGNLNMTANRIFGVSQIDFSDAEPWKISIVNGDFNIYEGAAHRFVIFDDDANGGFQFKTANSVLFANFDNWDLAILGGIRAGSTAANITDGYLYCNPTTTGLAVNTTLGLASGATYYVIRYTSARKYKDHISYASQEYLAGLELKPATFWRDDDQEWFIGYIADDLAETDYRLATYEGEDGSAIDENGPSGDHVPLSMDKKPEPDNIQTSAVLAVLGAKANRADDRYVAQQARIDRLEEIIKEITHGIHK